MNKNEIVKNLYTAYGTDSGILFGITEKSIVEAIVEFTLTARTSDELPSQPVSGQGQRIKALEDGLRELMEQYYETVGLLNQKLGNAIITDELPTYKKCKQLLNR